MGNNVYEDYVEVAATRNTGRLDEGLDPYAQCLRFENYGGTAETTQQPDYQRQVEQVQVEEGRSAQ